MNINIWTAICHDCKFETGMAEVLFPDGTKKLLSGAGCRERRDAKKAMEWAQHQIKEYQEQHEQG